MEFFFFQFYLTMINSTEITLVWQKPILQILNDEKPGPASQGEEHLLRKIFSLQGTLVQICTPGYFQVQ